MKTITFLSSIALVSISYLSIAQEKSQDLDNRKKLQIGLKAGLNYSNVYDVSGQDFKADAKFGLAAGAVLRIPLNKYLGLQPEVLISQKGFKGNGSLLLSRYDFTRTTTYLDVPLQFAIKPIEFFTLVAGPQFSYLLNQHDVFTSSSTSYVQEQQFQQDNIRKNIFGIVGGFDVNIKHITMGARIGGDVQNNNGDGTNSTPRYKNMWFQGTLGYAFYH